MHCEWLYHEFDYIDCIYLYHFYIHRLRYIIMAYGVIHLRRPHSGGGGGSGHFGFFRTGRGWPKMDVQLHLFLKTKFLFVLFSRTQLLNILKIQFEAFKFKECPASPFQISITKILKNCFTI